MPKWSEDLKIRYVKYGYSYKITKGNICCSISISYSIYYINFVTKKISSPTKKIIVHKKLFFFYKTSKPTRYFFANAFIYFYIYCFHVHCFRIYGIDKIIFKASSSLLSSKIMAYWTRFELMRSHISNLKF